MLRHMRVAVFGDIHGNLLALEAALHAIRHDAPDTLVCLGDVAMGGPHPRECVQAVAALGCPVVRGNADRLTLEPPSPFWNRGFPGERELHAADHWSHVQLTDAERDVIRTYQSVVSLPHLLCVHGSPERDDEALESATPGTRLEELRASYGSQSMWVAGHTHQPTLRSLTGWRLANPGSVGLPFEARGEGFVNLARAEYALLDHTRGGWQVNFRRVPYDVESLRRDIRACGMPHADWLAAEWVAE